MGCCQGLPLSVVQEKSKHCRNGVVDTFGLTISQYLWDLKCQRKFDFNTQCGAITGYPKEIFESFCPGTGRDRGICPGTFAPALVPGQRDTGTRIFFVPGQRDNGTSRLGLSRDIPRDVPSLGNTTMWWTYDLNHSNGSIVPNNLSLYDVILPRSFCNF